jgi:hypothetical protein
VIPNFDHFPRWGAVLDDTRKISNFLGGVYVIWNISGHVKINVTWTGGSNATLSGAFFH